MDKEKLYEQAERSGANKIGSNLMLERDRQEIEKRMKELFPDIAEIIEKPGFLLVRSSSTNRARPLA